MVLGEQSPGSVGRCQLLSPSSAFLRLPAPAALLYRPLTGLMAKSNCKLQ
jgi:hypothetical protein